jgi:hypothetical protein
MENKAKCRREWSDRPSHHCFVHLSAAGELAVFLSVGGHCLGVNGWLAETQLAHAQAHVLASRSPLYLAFLAGAVGEEMPAWRQVQIDLGQNRAVGNENQ